MDMADLASAMSVSGTAMQVTGNDAVPPVLEAIPNKSGSARQFRIHLSYCFLSLFY
jgi:hypothetical protein